MIVEFALGSDLLLTFAQLCNTYTAIKAVVVKDNTSFTFVVSSDISDEEKDTIHDAIVGMEWHLRDEYRNERAFYFDVRTESDPGWDR